MVTSASKELGLEQEFRRPAPSTTKHTRTTSKGRRGLGFHGQKGGLADPTKKSAAQIKYGSWGEFRYDS